LYIIWLLDGVPVQSFETDLPVFCCHLCAMIYTVPPKNSSAPALAFLKVLCIDEIVVEHS